MTDPPRDPGPKPPAMPRWVKVSGIIVGVLLLLVAILAITGVLGGEHGPGRHLPGGHRPPIDHGL